MKQLFLSLKGIIKHNFWIKMAALGVAAILWFFVIAETNPPRMKEFNDVPVTFSGTEALAGKGLTSVQDLNSIIADADVTVEANTDELKYLTEDMVSLTVDVSDVNTPGVYELLIEGVTSAGNVTKVEPSSVSVEIDDLVTSEIPVEVQMTGDKKENMYYGQPVLSQNTITISGARKNVEKYAKAVCYLDIGDLIKSTTESISAVILDLNGAAVDENLFGNELTAVIVSLDVFPEKTVSIDNNYVVSRTTGVAEGYKIDGVVLEPAAITIAAPKEVLDGIGSVVLKDIVLQNASADTSMTVAVELPDGVEIANPNQVEATVQISMIQEKKTYEAMDITVKNLDSGLRCTLSPEAIDVTVSGSHDVIAAIAASQIKPMVDLAGLTAGTHSVMVKFEDAPDIAAVMTPSAYSVEVTLKEK